MSFVSRGARGGRRSRTWAVALTAILSLACGVAAERRVASDVKMLPPLAGIGAADPRIRVDPEQGP